MKNDKENLIKELYYSELSKELHTYPTHPEYLELKQQLADTQANVASILADDCMLLEELLAIQIQMGALQAEAAYTQGFKTATQLILQALAD